MRTAMLFAAVLSASACSADAKPPAAEGPGLARATVGEPAPAFSLPDLDGNVVSLADHRGEIVVIEWFNPECPYVVYAHGDGPLAELPGSWTEKGVLWLPINSNHPGSQGSDPDINRKAVAEWGLPHSVLVDSDGTTGRAYGATNTPQMFIVDREGTLVYDGAVDNAPRGNVKGESHELWLDDALTDVVNGATVRRANNKAYGCSVKYGS